MKRIQSITRAMITIESLRGHEGLDLKDIHTKTGLDKATLLRILATLEDSAWVYKGISDGKYRLSYLVDNKYCQSKRSMIISELATNTIKRLHKQITWPSDIAVRKGVTMEVVESTKAYSSFVVNRNQVGVCPEMLFSALGRTYLTFCSDTERQEIITALRQLPTKEGRLAKDHLWLNKMLDETRKRGYGRREPHFWGVKTKANGLSEAIAVPIYCHGQVEAVLSAAWPEGAVSSSDVENKIYSELEKASKDISTILDCHLD